MRFDEGFIIVDKPPRLTSNEVSVFIKKITRSKIAGHIGTLDPNVTGILPVAYGQATKFIRFFSGKPKTYIGIIKFKNEVSKEKVLSLFSRFTGIIEQTPPKMSAVKKRPRKRKIYYIKFLEMEGKRVLFETKVQAGTYIRTLCEDIGKYVGGAYMEELRRIRVGNIDKGFRLNEINYAFNLYFEENDPKYVKKIVIPIDKMLSEYKKIIIRENAAINLKKGAYLMIPGILEYDPFEKGDILRIYDEKNEFIGMGKAEIDSKEIKKKKRGLVLKTLRIHV